MDTVKGTPMESRVLRWSSDIAPQVHALADALVECMADVAPYGLPHWLVASGQKGVIRPWGVLTMRRGHDPVFLLPLACQGAGILTACAAPSSDVAPFLVDTKHADAVFLALVAWLRAAPGVGALDLGLWDNAEQIAGLRDACAAGGAICVVRPAASDMRLALPGTWDAYLGGLSRNARDSVRDAEKRLARDYPDVRIDVPVDSAGLTLALDAQICLYRRRWHDQPGGCPFDDPRHVAAYRNAFVSVHEAGLGHIGILRAGGQPVVANNWYHHAGGDTLYCHLFARDTEALPTRYSPGMAAMAFLIRWAIDHGVRYMRLGSGSSYYKVALGGQEQPLWRVHIARNRAALGLLAVERVRHAATRLPVHIAYWGGHVVRRFTARRNR
jgi:CelD/BcsL family acetyltransferase involved in cellulose biosynthesis